MKLNELKEKGLAPEFLTEEALNTLSNGYLLQNETPIEMYKRCADFSASVYKNTDDYKVDFFEAIWNNWLCPATPVLSAANTENLQISCYSGTMSNKVTGIMDHMKEMAVLTKRGGGVGSSFDMLKPDSNDIIPFAKILEATIEGITQGKQRRGSVASYLNIKHPNAEEFINIRNPIGDLSRKCQSVAFHNAITIDDEVMNEITTKNGNYRKLWLDIMTNRVETGEPYLLFQDNANKLCPEEYKGTITQSNLCVSPETKILTDKGYIQISHLEGRKTKVWNGDQFSETVVVKTGRDQRLLKVVTNFGQEIECTPYHKFYVQEGYNKGTGPNKYRILEKRASELKIGDKLIKFSLPVIEGTKILPDAYANGFYTGDGCKVGTKQRIYLYGDKLKLKGNFNIKDWYFQPEQNRGTFHYTTLEDKFFIPGAEYSLNSRLQWLAGLLDSDGCLLTDRQYGTQSLQISSVNREFLRNLQLELQTLGVNSKVVLARVAGQYNLPANDGTSDLKEFSCKHLDRLLISSSQVEKLLDLGLKCHRLEIKRSKTNRDSQHFIKVASIELDVRTSDTYCFTESIKNMGMFNGLLTGNCSEIMAPVTPEETFVCCLSSLNLTKYDEWKDYKFPRTGLTLVELSIHFLDAVITNFIKQTENMDGLQNARRFAMRHRMLGLGVLGWHSLLQSKNIPFESYQAMQLNNEIFSKLRKESYAASESLGELYGNCEAVPSRRNSALLAVAPTMSNSLISGGVSQGIEPLTANIFSQKSAKGVFIKRNPVLIKYLQENNLDIPEVWEQINKDRGSVKNVKELSDDVKRVFLTAREINQFALINQASQRQKYIDQGQSLNLFFNLPNSQDEKKAVAKYINDVHLEAWKSGIKSLYYLKTDSPLKGDIIAIDKDGECKSCEG